MKMAQAIRQFYFWMNGRSSAKMYRSILEDLPGQDAELESITPQALQDHLSSFQGLSASSMNIKRACLRSFFSWCCDMELLQKNPARMIKAERIPVKEAKYLSLAEVKKFREAIKGRGRDELLFNLYLMSGCRLSEIQSLNIGDVRGKRSCRVIGKGQKARQIFLPEYLTKLVKYSVNGNPPESPLFLSQRGERLSKGRIQALFQVYLGKAGIKGHFSVHSLRHSFATHLYGKTKDIRLTQECLGHSSIQTTVRYSHIGQEDKKRAIQNLYQ